MNELFYGADEPGFMVTTSAQQLIRDPKLFVDSTFVQPAKQPAEQKKPEDKHKPIVMNVSICCSSCVDLLEPELLAVKGVKTVDCEVYKKKVTVTGTAALSDVISATRRHFKHAQIAS
ncbi:hypothetical protein MPTK1_7g17110 [Marchantia polymorpha subsp. ruderalis]|uniref:HMA domain-containing protein n=2 Tax=Marchantia polymorpha TaxID=3197 RepID=A0A176WQ00_MARPO|nr:hypothetical protein AXG93_167s1340 [Marchantia polymorpha subsp. ruderalis]PTQ38445.1 hypothetical protein MARPO_0051s0048 [Marchantia polymorpha]BBN17820.1 hypothetical protein Mp_7g17110 [Marchantia polymorpha subsp. ruderalis]|eukprot:PTQ38445.1 hypothetical protein MARPO_0051s0048 [Marchantia polymorpha]